MSADPLTRAERMSVFPPLYKGRYAGSAQIENTYTQHVKCVECVDCAQCVECAECVECVQGETRLR